MALCVQEEIKAAWRADQGRVSGRGVGGWFVIVGVASGEGGPEMVTFGGGQKEVRG